MPNFRDAVLVLGTQIVELNTTETKPLPRCLPKLEHLVDCGKVVLAKVVDSAWYLKR